MWVNRSSGSGQMSDCEGIAQGAQDKWVTVSKLLRSLMTYEWMWAICSGEWLNGSQKMNYFTNTCFTVQINVLYLTLFKVHVSLHIVKLNSLKNFVDLISLVSFFNPLQWITFILFLFNFAINKWNLFIVLDKQ